jgi:hypothetical protein
MTLTTNNREGQPGLGLLALAERTLGMCVKMQLLQPTQAVRMHDTPTT